MRSETYKNGRLHGDFIDYHVNGKKRSEGKVGYGEMQGNWIFWFHNGKKELECDIDFGEAINSARVYHDNGLLKQEVKL